MTYTEVVSTRLAFRTSIIGTRLLCWTSSWRTILEYENFLAIKFKKYYTTLIPKSSFLIIICDFIQFNRVLICFRCHLVLANQTSLGFGRSCLLFATDGSRVHRSASVRGYRIHFQLRGFMERNDHYWSRIRNRFAVYATSNQRISESISFIQHCQGEIPKPIVLSSCLRIIFASFSVASNSSSLCYNNDLVMFR